MIDTKAPPAPPPLLGPEDRLTMPKGTRAQHVKALPGRKTDTKDSEWLADLLRHGLLRGSFLPPAAIRELRDLTRYRKTLVQARSQEANRVQKLLEGANIKLAAVATNVLGVSGRQMLDAIIAEEEDPAALAEFARASLRKKLPSCARRWKVGASLTIASCSRSCSATSIT
jgi:transposase